jgi:hypothetical protein
VLLEVRQRLLGVLDFLDLEVGLLQDGGGDAAHLGMILDHEGGEGGSRFLFGAAHDVHSCRQALRPERATQGSVSARP